MSRNKRHTNRPDRRNPGGREEDGAIVTFKQPRTYSSKGRDYKPRDRGEAEYQPQQDPVLVGRADRVGAIDSCKMGYPMRKAHISKKAIKKKRRGACSRTPAKPVYVCGRTRKVTDKLAKKGYREVTGKNFCRKKPSPKGSGRLSRIQRLGRNVRAR